MAVADTQNVPVTRELIRELVVLNGDRIKAGEETVDQKDDVAAGIRLRIATERRRLGVKPEDDRATLPQPYRFIK